MTYHPLKEKDVSAAFFACMDLISIVRCAKVNRHLRSATKEFVWDKYKFTSNDPAIQHCLSNSSLLTMLKAFPLMQSAREWTWILSNNTPILFGIYEMLMHFNALCMLQLLCCYDNSNQAQSPVFNLNHCAFSATLTHLKIHCSWMRMVKLCLFPNLQSLHCTFHTRRLFGADIASMASCHQLRYLAITVQGDLNEVKESENEHTTIEALKATLPKLPSLSSLHVVVDNGASSRWFEAFPITAMGQLKDFKLNAGLNDVSSMPRGSTKDAFNLLFGHIPADEWCRIRLGPEALVIPEMEQYARVNKASPILQRCELRNITMNRKVFVLLYTTCQNTLQEIRLCNLELCGLEVSELCDILASITHLQLIDIEMEPTPEAWSADALDPLQKLTALASIRWICPAQFTRAHFKSIVRISRLTALEVDCADIADMDLYQLLNLQSLQRLCITAHHLTLHLVLLAVGTTMPSLTEFKLQSCSIPAAEYTKECAELLNRSFTAYLPILHMHLDKVSSCHHHMYG